MLNRISKFDSQNMLELLLSFPRQFNEAIDIGKKFNHQADRNKVKHVVFAGMGGSAIGGDLIVACLSNALTVPAMVNRNYFLPHFVNQSTLVIISSFSGNTEESLSCYEDAKKKRAQLLCITSGGELHERTNKDRVPAIIIPGGMPPRCALGYLSMPIMVFLIKSGFTDLRDDYFDETIDLLSQKSELCSPENPANPALEIAQKLCGRIPIIYSTNDMLYVVAQRWKGQLSENAKVLAFYNVFPELNHNEIVGWEQLPELLNQFQILYLRDNKDFSRNQARMKITKGILEKVTNSIIELKTDGQSKLARLFSLIYLGDMVSYYLAMLTNVDPTPIEKIQQLKDALREIEKK